ncbi:hypothetical protein AZI86_05605 [Bdellovibrio bacteriovorus]|uniref:Uncharacterized protein n=1 Tax=Bdellovibrio bacteriovorus TaxID=959 RepID=A0A150WPW1_BDEBC|nr:hypothetical protein [Bdellovibrio bacteriovorus]KYG66522.1 hypothetical protein AZI86_05605 [Bdellovibrio bacteriovorus]
MNHLVKLKFVFLMVIFLASGAAFAQKSKITQDSLRRQALQASAKEWFERNYLPRVANVLNPIESYSVSVTEQANVLPPDLGGPLNYVQVIVEGRISGWNYSRYHSHGSFSRFPEYGWAQCILKQKLWAHINAEGRPTKLMKNQAASSLVACGSSGFFPPEYHGIQRPRF